MIDDNVLKTTLCPTDTNPYGMFKWSSWWWLHTSHHITTDLVCWKLFWNMNKSMWRWRVLVGMGTLAQQILSWPPRCYSYVSTRPYRPEYDGLPVKCCNLGGVSIMVYNSLQSTQTAPTRSTCHTTNKGSQDGRSIEIDPVRSFSCYPPVYLPINK